MKKSSLKTKIWVSLSIFATFMLLCIWLLQIVSLDVFYEWSKSNEIKEIANRVVSYYNNQEKLDKLSFDKDVCIEIVFKKSDSYSLKSITEGCFGVENEKINTYKAAFINSNENNGTYTLINPRFDKKFLIYSVKIDNSKYAFISTSLEPVGSTVNLLKKQLIIITIIVLILAFLIAYTISKMISKPIEKITSESKKIKEGNYDVKFDTKTEIREINELESALNEMALELSKTESLRRELMANVSHDLKTPLTLIKANSEMVKDLTYKNKEKREKNLNTIINEVDRLNLLVEDILDLSKMQSNSLELEKTKFNLNTVIKSIIDKFSILESEGYNIIYDGYDVEVVADKKRIEQVIYNLLDNAIKFSQNDSVISVNITDKNDKIFISIKDSGIGIPKESLNKIWDRFYKTDLSRGKDKTGTGLGLSIVREIIAAHDEYINVISTEGVGTEFTFTLKKSRLSPS